MTKKTPTLKRKKKTPTVWINTRIEPTKREAIDKLVGKGNYPSRSAFFRTAIDHQLEKDLILDDAVKRAAS